ncbi:MAG: methionyl-tRNA formyltransferase [Nitrospinota bacterium]|nr:methionyl-tRNA formyltransferase [Nitrospinota bacterium]
MTDPLKVVFMGTPDFALPTLVALAEDQRFAVTLAVSQPDKPKGRGRKLSPTPVKLAAMEHDIPVIQPAKARAPEAVERIAAENPDYIVVVAYGQILPLSILEIPALIPVNLHASLLPRWRGAAPIHRALLAGDQVTGVCSMLMEEGLDTGDILLCQKTEITDMDTTGALHDRLAQTGATLMTRTLAGYAEGKITPRKQDSGQATYAPKLAKEEFVIDWSASAEEVSRKIRGLAPFPGAVTFHGGLSIKPLSCHLSTARAGGRPGEIQGVSGEGITVACGAGAVVITHLKPEGKGAMAAHAYTLGHGIKAGEALGK